jgi:hypothetical protein
MTNMPVGDVVSPKNPRKTIPRTMTPTTMTRTRSARRKSARGARRKRRKRRRGTRKNTVAVTKTRTTMLTSVVQVRANTDAVRAPASKSTGARRARARLLSATLAATSSHTILVVMDKNAGMVRRLRVGMVDALEALAMGVKKSLDMVARSLLAMAAKSSPDTVVNKRATDMVNRSPPVTVARKSLVTVAAQVATVVRNPQAMEAIHMDLAVATVAVRNLLGTRAVTVDVATVVKSPSATTECLEVSVATTSLAKGASVESITDAVAMMTMSSTVSEGRRAVTEVAMEARRRAMAAGTETHQHHAVTIALSRSGAP